MYKENTNKEYKKDLNLTTELKNSQQACFLKMISLPQTFSPLSCHFLIYFLHFWLHCMEDLERILSNLHPSPFHSFQPSIYCFRVILSVWCRCVERPRGRLTGGSDSAGTKTGLVKPRSLEKLRKCSLSTTLSQPSSQVTSLKNTSIKTLCKIQRHPGKTP